MLESESQPPSEISLLLTSEDDIRELNARYRGKNKPTDVLSFPHTSVPVNEGFKILGDIVICLEFSKKQAQEFGTDLSTEVACLAVHGGLHLLGYNDKTKKQAQQMNKKMYDAVLKSGGKPAKEWGSLPH
jgi:probable rRNA maturation factor